MFHFHRPLHCTLISQAKNFPRLAWYPKMYFKALCYIDGDMNRSNHHYEQINFKLTELFAQLSCQLISGCSHVIQLLSLMKWPNESCTQIHSFQVKCVASHLSNRYPHPISATYCYVMSHIRTRWYKATAHMGSVVGSLWKGTVGMAPLCSIVSRSLNWYDFYVAIGSLGSLGLDHFQDDLFTQWTALWPACQSMGSTGLPA